MTGVVSWARLSYRLQRLEILLLGAAVLLASGLMLWWAFQLDGIAAAHPDCDFFDPAVACQAAGQLFSETFSTAEIIIRNTGVVGFVVGLVLGVPLVAREVDHGTAQLAWTIGRSRVRWLIGRVAFAVVVVVALTGLLAVATELLASAMYPAIDVSQDFFLYGNRGPLMVGRALLGLGAGVLVGAVLGRQLPALLLGVFLIGGLYWASVVGFQRWYEAEAVTAYQGEWLGGPIWVGSGIELASSERLSWQEFEAIARSDEMYMGDDGSIYVSQEDYAAGRNAVGREYVLIVPGERYNQVVARETAVFASGGLILIGAAAAVTRRRRPA
ncbi:MAG: hypothetical protein ACRDHD_02295 [Candidatus Limnocylindria bacterium]